MRRSLFPAVFSLLLLPLVLYAAGDPKAGEAKYKQLCETCHGPQGKGDGPAGAALNPKPRDLTDPEWQKKVTDDHIKKVIKEGGQAVGLSPLMPPWGAQLNDKDLNDLVAFIRSLGKSAPKKK